ncbi:MAG: hypothetical protein WC679_01240 [Bacteroidales bacterium]|jgi:hypothetical protein
MKLKVVTYQGPNRIESEIEILGTTYFEEYYYESSEFLSYFFKVELVDGIWRVVVLCFDDGIFTAVVIKPIEQFEIYDGVGISDEERFNEKFKLVKSYLKAIDI